MSNKKMPTVNTATPAGYYRQGRKHEDGLTKLNEALDRRLQARTGDVAEVNESLDPEASDGLPTW